jgi:hypothetical protein
MRQVLFGLLLVVSLGLTGHLAARTGAQSATPPAASFPPGVTADVLALGFGALPNQTDVELIRWTLEPGTVFTDNPLNPATALIYVEAGSLTVDFAAPLVIERGAALDVLTTPGVAMPPPDEVAAAATASLAAGDSVVIPLHAEGELRNEGTEPVVFLTALVTPREGGALMEATPAA